MSSGGNPLPVDWEWVRCLLEESGESREVFVIACSGSAWIFASAAL